jgi:Glycosyltransferase family 87
MPRGRAADTDRVNLTRERRVVGLAAFVMAGASAVVLAILLQLTNSGDYAVQAPVQGDNAGPALNALVHGPVSRIASMQPLMGLTSLLWRGPFVAVGDALGGDRLAYALGCAACLLPAAGVLGWLLHRAPTSRQVAVVALAAAAIFAGPATRQAIVIGHPEEVLTIVLAAGAVICASDGRRRTAAVLLGLAVGTKQWALLAAPCVLLAVPDRRAALAGWALVVAAPLSAILPLADPAAFSQADAAVGGLRIADPLSLWWPAGPSWNPHFSAHVLPLDLTRSDAAAFGLVLGVVGLCVVALRVRRDRGGRIDPLPLLALLGLLRCLTDPDPLAYNFVAAVIPLAIWEAGTLRRIPIVTGLTCVALALLPSGTNAFRAGQSAAVSVSVLSGLSIGWELLLGWYLLHQSFRPRPEAVTQTETPSVALEPALSR